jgi:signal transduction histidine kinase
MKVWAQALITGLIAFILTAAVVWVAQTLSPIFASLLWSFPMSLVIVVATFTLSDRDPALSGSLALATGIFILSTFIMEMCWGLLIIYGFEEYTPSNRVWASFGVAITLWGLYILVIMMLYFYYPPFRRMIDAGVLQPPS